MKSWLVIVVGGIVAIWLWMGNIQKQRLMNALFPTPQEVWQQKLDAEAASTTLPPKVELPPAATVVLPDHVRIDEVRMIRIWSPDYQANEADLIQAKYLWMQQNPGAGEVLYNQEIHLLAR
jgi:hypothetical protein